ncbi:FHA domain-containing protein DDL-like [Dorcoceras hygrometricum]|uniref:FHA domain-containing protein DDL-like n=1 Tax=Dorcoceras hygrometricum TaxID=472368 RepID=A0A2Z7C0R6_9LAMI|nr:FHA domain-containing protein DDL-like [Dorcoceras hygrometricum]
MSSWTQSSISLDKLCEIQKPTNDRTGLVFNTGESSSGETCTQSNLAHDKLKRMSFVKASVIHDPCESVRYDDQISEPLNKKGKAGIGYDRPESSKSGWLKSRLDKEKAKAGSNSFVQNQQRRGSKKVKSEWKKVRPRRDLNGQNIKPKLNRFHSTYAQTLMDYHTGKAVKVIQVWVPKGDMVTVGSKQAKGYAIQISLLLENVPNLELGDSSEFPSSRILTKKTVHRYIAVNDKVGVEEVADVPRVKKTPVKKAVSRKRPTAVDETTVKKKRTNVGKASAVATDSALEAVPVQVVAPISTVPPPAPKCKIHKRKRMLALGSDDEITTERASVKDVVESAFEKESVETTADLAVKAPAVEVETDVGRTNDSGPDIEDHGVKTADETELWFNLSYEEFATRI